MATIRVGPMARTLLLAATLMPPGAAEEQTEQLCANLFDVKQKCSSNGCTVLADRMVGRSCADYCAAGGYSCAGAWEQKDKECGVGATLACEQLFETTDLLCQCGPAAASPPSQKPPSEEPPSQDSVGNGMVVSTFFWNVHWECSSAMRGASPQCREHVGRRFAELAKAAGAEIVGSMMLKDGPSTPSSLVDFGLPGWMQVNGGCDPGSGRADATALAFAPGWAVHAGGGGCLRHDWDARAFAVALVGPPRPIRGCPRLCVVALHAPHSSITAGADVVRSVCGDAADRCAMAMGDWNVPGGRVQDLWRALIGGAPPGPPAPNERTCCFPEDRHYGVFDHLATNVGGARHAGHTVHPYQILADNPRKQHKPVAARLALP